MRRQNNLVRFENWNWVRKIRILCHHRHRILHVTITSFTNEVVLCDEYSKSSIQQKTY